MSPVRRVASLALAALMIGGGGMIYGYWLFMGGGMPRGMAAVAGVLIGVGCVIAYEDIRL
jgi:hypothetical protein